MDPTNNGMGNHFVRDVDHGSHCLAHFLVRKKNKKDPRIGETPKVLFMHRNNCKTAQEQQETPCDRAKRHTHDGI